MNIDLHMHTNESDGTYSSDELIKLCHAKELGLVSITDHDSIVSLKEGCKSAAQSGILFINGVEISSVYKNEYIHILGYGFDVENDDINKLMAENRLAFEKKDIQFVENLISEGIRIKLDDYLNYTAPAGRGGWKVLNFLIDQGICKDIYSFLREFTPGGILPLAKLQTPDKVIQTILAAGGIPVLAHPGSYKKIGDLRSFMISLREAGMQGIECFTSKNSERITRICQDFCSAYDLLITGGSDFHGDFSHYVLGEPALCEKDISFQRIIKLEGK